MRTLAELLALINDAEAFAALSAEELEAVMTELNAQYAEARKAEVPDVPQLKEAVAAMATVDARITALDAEAQAEQDELDALDAQVAQLAGDGEGDDGEGEGEGGGDDAGEGAGDGEGEGEGEGGTDGGDGEGEGSGAGDEAGRVAASAGTRTRARARRRDLAELGSDRDQAGGRDLLADVPASRIVAAASGFRDVRGGEDVTPEVFGAELSVLHEAMQTLQPGQLPRGATAGGAKHYLAILEQRQKPGVVVMQAGDGSEIIDRAVREHTAAREARDSHNQRQVASGGVCVMAVPDFSVKLVGARGTCFTDDLPTIQGAKPLAYYPWLMIDQSSAAAEGRNPSATGNYTTAGRPEAGIGFVTDDQDAAGYGDPDADGGSTVPEGGVPFKTGIHIDCPPEPLGCKIEAVYKQVTLGNFQAASHPEYVDAFQTYMDIWFDIERDTRALDAFIAEATAQNHLLSANEATFGAVSTLKDVFNRMIAQERSARHDQSLGLNVWAPNWFGGSLALDVMRHTFGGLENLKATPAQALSLASTDGIRLGTYCTETNAGDVEQVLRPITNGAVPDWPRKVRLLAAADGAVFKKTSGQLRVGLRETLVKSNDFGMFEETMEKVCFRGPVYVLDVELCNNGATGAPVALVCDVDAVSA